jgi:predicted GH43/DUF377 family glycosyl hydrolase
MDALRINRQQSVRFVPDPRRVITKLFMPGDEIYRDGSSRLEAVLERIMSLTEDEVAETLGGACALFSDRHRGFDAVLDRHHDVVAARFSGSLLAVPMTIERRRLIGAYFTHEYSIEAAALGNPSIVVAPDQSGVAAGAVRFVMSLRAIGEGHVSSIEFRTGVVDADGTVKLDPVSPYAETGVRSPHAYDKGFFSTKLDDLAMLNEVEERVLARLSERFTMSELESAIAKLDDDGIDRSISGETTRFLHWLASSNYRVSFPPSTEISERVLFPSGPTESHGMEDARFVRFVDDDGTVTYFATYTAYDGHQILPQLIETADFSGFRIATLTGHAAQNKGMAIFPRRIGGRYVALSRQDNVNNFVMTSTDIRVWREATRIQEPKQPWELMQLGNCGSPLETDAGWLVITHGVGPMRRYTLGALLLDIDDPSHVIGHLREPLLLPSADEREGYVPNVVYSCGSLIHGDHLVLPYGYADVGASIATIRVDELLSRLTDPPT